MAPSFCCDSVEQSQNEISAPTSPSAAPSPYHSTTDLASLNAQLLAKKFNVLDPPALPPIKSERRGKRTKEPTPTKPKDTNADATSDGETVSLDKKKDDDDNASGKTSDYHHEDGVMSYHAEDQIEARLKQLADLMIADRRCRMKQPTHHEKDTFCFRWCSWRLARGEAVYQSSSDNCVGLDSSCSHFFE